MTPRPMTREQWADAFLEGIGAKATQRNLYVVVSWIQAEGGNAKWNPLNTTHDAPGATDYNWVGVKNYPTYEIGLKAAVDTLNYGANRREYGYAEIRKRFRNDAWPRRTLHAIERSEWGTGGLALACLKWIKKDWALYRNLLIND